MSTPARGYKWADFEAGNTVSLRHGAESGRTIEARARTVHAQLLEVAPWLSEPHFAPEVARYLRSCAREELIHEYIIKVAENHGVGDVPSRLWEQATAAARLASQLGDGLGLTPAGHAKLKMLVAGGAHAEHTLADLIAEGQRVIAAREARERAASTQEPPGDDGTIDASDETGDQE